MGNKDARVDAYIAASAAFAQPVLNELRDIVHQGCPEVEETIKWSMPFFTCKGILCYMAAFKEHCAFGFWKGRAVLGEAMQSSEAERQKDGMGHIGRLTSLEDLPPRRVLLGYVKKAVKLKEENETSPSTPKPRAPKKALPVPGYLAAALKKNQKASAAFEGFPPGRRREYIEWLTEAKTETTRQKRLDTAIEWIAEGKSRNWKYEKC
ncbi:YdeI/OmpD-associated family protein [Paracidobacterium acidisoli]|uniref:YdhG-like domain-containing protein n=1 Tax=Paracidobacterium acidisoli TaxID=2303751 RepID=A0A372ITC5_9BACT|nr:YdeI/OmpD-associated family protein [Paracidobacterium acidisoli]MBT9329432.1 YdeI/OmpD-associated family protein [Paracidobacterium acidisoli]